MFLAVTLLIAMAFSPVFDAVKHGPATAAIEHSPDHASNPTPDPHHNMNDHDHTVVVILPPAFAQPVQFADNFDLPAPDQMSDTLPQLPRRPPRTS